MIGSIYNSQKQKTRDEVWNQAQVEAENRNDHQTAEDFVEEVISGIKASCIEVAEDYVPVEFDESRDEIYYSRDKKELIGRTEDSVWFETDEEDFVVRNRLSSILESFDVNLGLVSSEEKKNGVIRYDIKIPFISEEERQENIREDTVDIARNMREYKDVDEDNIVGDCSREGCTGKHYTNSMGSCGPKYECTRFDCGFTFVKDVL